MITNYREPQLSERAELIEDLMSSFIGGEIINKIHSEMDIPIPNWDFSDLCEYYINLIEFLCQHQRLILWLSLLYKYNSQLSKKWIFKLVPEDVALKHLDKISEQLESLARGSEMPNKSSSLSVSSIKLDMEKNQVSSVGKGVSFSENINHINSRHKHFGRYRIVSLLGRGGMGRVYKAYDPLLNREIALKLILIEKSDKAHQRFMMEAKNTAQLKHNNIVRIFDIEEQDGEWYLAMEFIEGQTLENYANKQSLAELKIVQLVDIIAQALSYAHKKKIIHRDLKPRNIIIDTEGEPQIIDFGLAKSLTDVSELTGAEDIIGTPYYVPPEQITKKSLVDSQSDVYSLGVILYELITGRRPFESDNHFHLLTSIVETTPQMPRTLNPQISSKLENICLQAMHKDKTKRFLSMQDLSKALQLLL